MSFQSTKDLQKQLQLLEQKGEYERVQELCAEILQRTEEAEKEFYENSNDETHEKILHRCIAFHSISIIYLQRGQYRDSIEYNGKALRCAEIIDEKPQIGRAYGNLGIVYSNLTEHEKALENFQKALQINREEKNRVGEARNLGSLGAVYSDLSKIPEALQYYKQAAEIAEEIGDKRTLSAQYGNIGNIYTFIEQFDRALEFLSRALELSEEIGDKQSVGLWCGNIAVTYTDKGETDSATEYYDRAIRIAQELGDARGLSLWLGNKGSVSIEKLEFEKAVDYFSRSMEIAESIGDVDVHASMLHSLGGVWEHKENKSRNVDTAIQYIERALQLFEQSGGVRKQVSSHDFLARLWAEKGDYEKAYHHSCHHIELHKQVENEEVQKSVQENTVRYLERETKLLQEKNQEIDAAFQEVRRLNDKLQEVNQEKNEFIAIAVHDLKSPLAGILSLTELALGEIDTTTQSSLRVWVSKIRSSSQRMREIITKILDINKIEEGLVSPHLARLRADFLLESMVDEVHVLAEEKHISFRLEGIVPCRILIDEHFFREILTNLLSNAIKYSSRNSIVDITMSVQDQKVRIGIFNPGKGIREDEMGKLFGKFQRLSTRPTAGESSTGLGLSIVKKLVEMMNGRVWCESEYGVGATFYIEFEQVQE